MPYSNIKSEDNNGIRLLSINRPDKLNALNTATLAEIRECVHEAINNPGVKGVILTGEGPKAFAAGADISEFFDISAEQGAALSGSGHQIFNMIENSPIPIIAAVNGFALGGGCELAMSCHFRTASENAKFGQPEVNLGLIPGYGGTQRLIRLVGYGKAMELLMTADMITAEEARNLGLVNHVVAPEELLPFTMKIMEKILSKSPIAVRGIIKCANAYNNKELNGFQVEIDEFSKCFGTEDFKEGTTAFVEKRKAVFPGK